MRENSRGTVSRVEKKNVFMPRDSNLGLHLCKSWYHIVFTALQSPEAFSNIISYECESAYGFCINGTIFETIFFFSPFLFSCLYHISSIKFSEFKCSICKCTNTHHLREKRTQCIFICNNNDKIFISRRISVPVSGKISNENYVKRIELKKEKNIFFLFLSYERVKCENKWKVF